MKEGGVTEDQIQDTTELVRELSRRISVINQFPLEERIRVLRALRSSIDTLYLSLEQSKEANVLGCAEAIAQKRQQFQNLS